MSSKHRNESDLPLVVLARKGRSQEAFDTSDHGEAAKASKRCQAKGIVVSLVDVLLCVVAIKREWAIFTTDPDFANYAKLGQFTVYVSTIIEAGGME